MTSHATFWLVRVCFGIQDVLLQSNSLHMKPYAGKGFIEGCQDLRYDSSYQHIVACVSLDQTLETVASTYGLGCLWRCRRERSTE